VIKISSQGAVRVFAVEGPLNHESAASLQSAVTATPVAGRPQWVLDLAETPLVDSAGCEALLDARDAAAKVGGAVHLAGLSPLVRDVLLATGVLRYFQAFAGVKQAVAQFAR
jgi:anti-anti-sigma factor